MPTAADAVWNCTELLELILSFVPAETLLTAAQLTCRRWQAVISWSNKLQRCLFFMPDYRCLDADFALNPLLVQRFKYMRDPHGYLLIAVRVDGEGKNDSPCDDGSWRDMLMAQPPEPFTMTLRENETANWYGGAFNDETRCGLAWNSIQPDGRFPRKALGSEDDSMASDGTQLDRQA